MKECRRAVRSHCAAALICVIASLGFAKTLSAEPVIRGDATLLETVREALERNQQALSVGECDIRVEYGCTPEDTNGNWSTTADVHFLWDGDQSFARYTYTKNEVGDDPWVQGHGSQIINGAIRTVYVPEGDLCETRPYQPSGVPTFRDALPADVCFHWMHMRELPWTHFVADSPWLAEVELSQDGDIISVKVIGNEPGYTCLAFSLAHGCNITSWEYFEHDEKTAWGSQEWSEIDGVWYPTVSTHEWHSESMVAGRAISTFRMEIVGFNPTPAIGPNSFTIDALQLPIGTQLELEDARGRPIGDRTRVGMP